MPCFIRRFFTILSERQLSYYIHYCIKRKKEKKKIIPLSVCLLAARVGLPLVSDVTPLRAELFAQELQ